MQRGAGNYLRPPVFFFWLSLSDVARIGLECTATAVQKTERVETNANRSEDNGKSKTTGKITQGRREGAGKILNLSDVGSIQGLHMFDEDATASNRKGRTLGRGGSLRKVGARVNGLPTESRGQRERTREKREAERWGKLERSRAINTATMTSEAITDPTPAVVATYGTGRGSSPDRSARSSKRKPHGTA